MSADDVRLRNSKACAAACRKLAVRPEQSSPLFYGRRLSSPGIACARGAMNEDEQQEIQDPIRLEDASLVQEREQRDGAQRPLGAFPDYSIHWPSAALGAFLALMG